MVPVSAPSGRCRAGHLLHRGAGAIAKLWPLAAVLASVKLDSFPHLCEGTRMTVMRGQDCTTMAEVRAGVDALDRELVALLRRRFDYMDAAARIKPERGAVRDERRKAEVIANARAAAEAAGLPGAAIADLWDRLVEASIAYELEAFDARVTAS